MHIGSGYLYSVASKPLSSQHVLGQAGGSAAV